MTDDKLKRANELKEFIDGMTAKLSDMDEIKRLATTPYESDRYGNVKCIDLISGELKIKWRWNQNSDPHSFDETSIIPDNLIPAIWKMVYEENEKQLAKAIEEYESL